MRHPLALLHAHPGYANVGRVGAAGRVPPADDGRYPQVHPRAGHDRLDVPEQHGPSGGQHHVARKSCSAHSVLYPCTFSRSHVHNQPHPPLHAAADGSLQRRDLGWRMLTCAPATFPSR